MSLFPLGFPLMWWVATGADMFGSRRRGAFSVVHLAFNTWSLKQIACKKIRKRRLSKGDIANVTREIDILKTISHVGLLPMVRGSPGRLKRICPKQPNINAVENAYYHEEEMCAPLRRDLILALC